MSLAWLEASILSFSLMTYGTVPRQNRIRYRDLPER